MRMKMDNPRFLFLMACAALVLLALASSGTKVIGPCDCTPLEEGNFRVTFVNDMSDCRLKIFCTGSDIGERGFILDPLTSGGVDLSKAESWRYEAWKSKVDPPGFFEFIREGKIPGPVTITISQ
jgi:hypothetical protein